MSQIYKPLTSSGPIPPIIPTQFTADDATVAIPAANNLNVFSRDTTENNDNGIQTTADPNASDNLYLELTNRLTGSVSTTDSTLTTILSLPLGATPACFYVYGNVQAFDSTTPLGGCYSYSGGFRTDGIAATELGVEIHDEFEDPGLVAADIFVTVSGNDIIIQIQGVAATNLNWSALLEYRRLI